MTTYPSSTTPPSTQPFDPGIALLGEQQYDAAYMAALPPQVLAYMKLPYGPADVNYIPGQPSRTDASQIAAIARLVPVDMQIMVWGWDPCMTMTVRINNGYTWSPSYGQPAVPAAPGINGAMLGVASYNPSSPPAGSIIMPLWDSQGYLIPPAPYAAPSPVTPTAPVPMAVGPFEIAGINPLDGNQFDYLYGVVGGTTPKVGQQVTSNGQTFQLVQYPMESPMAVGQLTTLWKLILTAPATTVSAS